MKFGSLFTGIGGMDLGLERAGLTCAWQVEIDDFCQRVLAKHWPEVRRFGDITQLSGYELEPVDLICGGFPCQPVSVAGQRQAQDDERWLWPEFHRIVRLLRPNAVLVENVPGLLDPVRVEDDEGTPIGWFPAPIEEVLGDLAESGYDAEWDCIPAAAVGAPHIRDRVWILAYPARNEGRERNGNGTQDVPDASSAGRQARGSNGVRTEPRSGEGLAARSDSSSVSDPTSKGLPERQQGPLGSPPGHAELERFRGSRGQWWASEPSVGRVATGVPRRVDRLKSLGNAVVPQVAEFIGRRLMEIAA